MLQVIEHVLCRLQGFPRPLLALAGRVLLDIVTVRLRGARDEVGDVIECCAHAHAQVLQQ